LNIKEIFIFNFSFGQMSDLINIFIIHQQGQCENKTSIFPGFSAKYKYFIQLKIKNKYIVTEILRLYR